MIVNLDIPDEALGGTNLPKAEWESEVRKEIALAFYERGLLSAGKATELSKVSRMTFEQWVAERKIVRPLVLSDLDQEAAGARRN